MSQDLFAAFGEFPSERPTQKPPSISSSKDYGLDSETVYGQPSKAERGISSSYQDPSQQIPGSNDDDDFGDFEDAAAPSTTSSAPFTQMQKPKVESPSSTRSKEPSVSFPPKGQARPAPAQTLNSKIGKHPFAGHMDFLFEPGDEEYDAGADDLDNLANNPEAAMAYSKKLIAEQEAQSQRTNPAHTGSTSNTDQYTARSVSATMRPSAAENGQPKKLTKAPPKSHRRQSSTQNPPPARNKLKKKSGYAPAKNQDILFDADNLSATDDEDDDFGDFEGRPTGPVATVITNPPERPKDTTSMPNVDLLGLEDSSPVSLVQIGQHRIVSPSTSNDAVLGLPKPNTLGTKGVEVDDNPWADFETETPKQTQPTPLEANVLADGDAWDDFEAAEPPPVITSPSDRPVSVALPHSQASSVSQLPPTNIPPPALLLSTFPSIFATAQDVLFLPLSRLDATQRNQLLSHAATHQFLRSYLNSALTLAHIIAGRKYRWKRDQILAQSMRIGPAAAGGKGGMKLTGVDRGEVAKEEREVLDAVRSWKEQIGKLRGAVASASTSGKRKLPAVPDISEQMPVKTLKAVEGGFVAPHACALCGLKREERVGKVDEGVEDSFGEWWVQGMDMHVSCKDWWETNKTKLRSR